MWATPARAISRKFSIEKLVFLQANIDGWPDTDLALHIFAQNSDSLSKSPRDGSSIPQYVRLMRTISELEDERVFLFKVATLIFSATWGLNRLTRAGETGERPELPSLYAAYVSLCNR
jgi:hypothetical protein